MHCMLFLAIVGSIISLFNTKGGSTSKDRKPPDSLKGLKELTPNPSSTASKETPNVKVIMQNYTAGNCNLTYYDQAITHPGCKPKSYKIGYCVGRCTSSYTPFIGGTAVENCRSCQVESSKLKNITAWLFCSNKKKKILKELEVIRSCRCTPCNVGDGGGSGEIDDSEESKEIGGYEENGENSDN